MKSLTIPFLTFLSGAIVGTCMTAIAVSEGETPAATHPNGRENAAAANAQGDVNPTTSTGAKVMNAILIRATLLDVGSPDTWNATVSEAHNKQRAIAAELINIAGDETESDESRREAIFQLGKVGNRTALEFLVKNVALHLPLERVKGDDDDLKGTPCQYTLVFSGNWRVAQLVIESMDAPKSKFERIYLAFVLESCLGKSVAKRVVEEHISRGPYKETAQRTENLKAIKTILFD